MRIGIFTNVLAHEPTGIGWHVIHLLDHLAAIDCTNQYYLFYRIGQLGPRREFYKPQNAPNFHNVPVRVPEVCYSRYSRFFTGWFMPRALARHRIDVFHGPNHYVPKRCNIPQIVTFHDLAEAKFMLGPVDNRAQNQESTRRCLARADHVIAISECTKRDIVEYGFPPERVHVIYEGGNFGTIERATDEQVESAKQKFRLDRPYLLFVGSQVERKNLGFLIKALARLKETGECPLLVLAGANDTPEAERLRMLVATLGLGDLVRSTGYLSSAEITSLYCGASAFVFPSLYEGFGMVALEAMAYRVPVISTRAGALEEVVADAGLLVDLDDDVGLADAIRRVLGDKQLAQDLIARGQRRLGDFSWKQCAEQTLALYETARQPCAASREQRGRPAPSRSTGRS